MATNTYTALATQTLGTAASSVTFSSIPQGYTDLRMVISAKSTHTATTQVKLNFNSDTSSNYSWTRLFGDGSSPGSDRTSATTYYELGYISGTDGSGGFDILTCDVMNYSNATTYKTSLTKWQDMNASSKYLMTVVSLWKKTPEAINTIALTTSNGNFATGSTFTIYGIAAQVTPGTAKATGGTITYDNYGNVIHTFTSNGTFTPTSNLTGVDYLVVAGAGGGGGGVAGSRGHGGGGAGGYRTTVGVSGGGSAAESTLSLTSGTGYAVTVGAGGSGNSGLGLAGSGTSSVFSTITSIGGGGGASATLGSNGANGGSGGGAGDSVGSATSGGTGTSGQGFRGGNNGGAPGGMGGSGGGGAASAGGDLASGTATGSSGGSGIATAISSSSVTYASGGKGGDASAGGTAGATGSANTGIAGGGGNGGSCIVIIRYSGV